MRISKLKGDADSARGICIIWSIYSGVMKKRMSPDEDGLLVGNVMGLAFEGKFGEMMNLGKKIQGQIGLPEFDFVTMVQENLPEP